MFKFLNTYFLLFLFSLSTIHAQSSSPGLQDNSKNEASARKPFWRKAMQKKELSDTTKINRHSPAKAMLFSACIPGLGQAYNKKYWKIPLVYASMGTTLYFFNFNNTLYKEYKQAYIDKTDKDPTTIDPYPNYSESIIHDQVTYYRKYRDLNAILTLLFYTLNVVDAYVDAHLMDFDVSDNLSLHVAPTLNFLAVKQKPSAGLTLTMRF